MEYTGHDVYVSLEQAIVFCRLLHICGFGQAHKCTSSTAHLWLRLCVHGVNGLDFFLKNILVFFLRESNVGFSTSFLCHHNCELPPQCPSSISCLCPSELLQAGRPNSMLISCR